MTYELTLALKRGTLEVEFDTMDELERKLYGLDVPRIEKLVAEAMRRKGPGKKGAAKKGARKGRAKKGGAGRARA